MPRLLNLLFQNGADPNIKDKDGKTFLDYMKDYPEMAELLTEHGAISKDIVQKIIST